MIWFVLLIASAIIATLSSVVVTLVRGFIIEKIRQEQQTQNDRISKMELRQDNHEKEHKSPWQREKLRA